MSPRPSAADVPGPVGSNASALNGDRRTQALERLADRPETDLLVVGGGVTGTGIALDAAARGLSVLLVERHDLAYGTSRWSSKLVHGGLRYLAKGRLGIAYESARERHVLLSRTAPHLVRALPMLLPLHQSVSAPQAAMTRAGFLLGDALRVAAGTRGGVLPRARRVSRERVLDLAPAVRPYGLRGGQLSYDGQLVDDARLVVGLARTAAREGATVLTRCSAAELSGRGAVLRDELTGERLEIRARAVVNAAGVWADRLVPGVRLRPSRGSHLVLSSELLGGLRAALTIPVPGELSRFVLVLPQPDGRVYVGLTDEPLDGPVPDVPTVPDTDIDFLLDVVSGVLDIRLRRTDVIGAYAGLRPLLEAGDGARASADLSRDHAVLTSPDGVVTIVGGKLTTYRRMAEEAVDMAVARGGLTAGPCRTARLPLVGAGSPRALARVPAPAPLVARYGLEAPAVLAAGGGAEEVAAGVTEAELVWGVRCEGALDEGDLLDRRTRIGLVGADRDRALDAARRALQAGRPATA